MVKQITNTTNETKDVGKKLAPFLKKGNVFVLTGDLGAGKTMFVSGILSYFGKEKEVSSPTFTIVNEYKLTNDLMLYHFDVYRFDFEDEFAAIGGEEFFDKGICLIEWGEKIPNYLPSEYMKITIHKDTEDNEKRIIEFTPFGKQYEKLLTNLSEVL